METIKRYFYFVPLALLIPVGFTAYFEKSLLLLAWVDFVRALVWTLLLVLAVRLLVLLLRGRRPSRASLLNIAALAAMWLMILHSRDYRRERMEDNLMPLLGALERYKAEVGSYPEKLEELEGRYLDRLPLCEFEPRPPFYVLHRIDSGLSLICLRPSWWGSSRYVCDKGGGCRVLTSL
jgi:hypothetical protein